MSTENLQHPEQGNNEISIKDFLLTVKSYYRFLRTKWLLIVIISLIGGVLGLTYSILKQPVFTATTTFVLEGGDNASNLGQYAGLASIMGIDLNTGGGIFQGNNILELYRSRMMIEKALLSEIKYKGKNTLLVTRFAEFNELFDDWQEKPHLKNFRFEKDYSRLSPEQTRLQDSLVGDIAGTIAKAYLVILKPEKNNIIRVDVNAKDEFFAKTFNDLIVANVNDFYVQTKTRKSMVNVNILQAKADSIRRIMNGAIFSAAAVADATPNINASRLIQRNAPIQRSQFSAETNKAILGELVKNLELSKMSLLRETPLIQVVDYPKYPLYRTKSGRITYFILGTILFGFFTVVVLLSRKALRDVMA